MSGLPRIAVHAWSYRRVALALSSSLLACGEAAENERVPVSVTAPVRAVSLSPVGTELLIALGAGAALVGVDAESGRLADLGEIPVVGLEGVAALHADLVLVARLEAADEAVADQLRSRGSDVIEVAPHDFDDAFALLRDLGARIAGVASARRFENEIGRELARIAGASFGRPRPRIAALLGVAPLELAGGHSFATDLIEIAGGSSVTHGGEERLVRMSAEELVASGPHLVLVTSSTALSEEEQEAVRAALPIGLRIGFFAFDADRFWVRDAVGTAARLRAVVEPLSLELEER